MRSNAEIRRIANGIYGTITEGAKTLTEIKANTVAGIKGQSFQDGFTTVLGLIASVEAIVEGAHYDTIALPPFLAKCEAELDDLSTVTIRIRSKLNSRIKYKKEYAVKVIDNDALINDLVAAYTDALFQMYYQEQAMGNVDDFNIKMAELCAEHDLPHVFELAVDVTTPSVVLSVTDEKVVLNAGVAKSLDMLSMGIFQVGEGYNGHVRENATADFIDTLKAVETPVQVIKSKLREIENMTGTISRRRADKLIRETYHRKAMHLGKIKQGVGYYEDKVTINGEEVDIFALVEKNLEGEYAVVLTPFNIKDLTNVEYDVLSAVKAQMEA